MVQFRTPNATAITLTEQERSMLTSARKKRGLTRTELGRLIGTGASLLQACEAGRTNPGFGVYRKWAQELGFVVEVKLKKAEQ